MKLIMFTEAQESNITTPTLGTAKTKSEKFYHITEGTHAGLHSGFWECFEGTFTIEEHATHELCHILEGECDIVYADDSIQKVKAGDSFIIPKGTKTTWVVPSYIRKVYMVAP